MTAAASGKSTRTTRLIKAPPEAVYAAFTDPAALVAWLPPGEMTGKIRDFAAGIGGGYRMSLFYPPNQNGSRGKTAAGEDRVTVRFLDLAPSRRIVEAVTFESDDPALQGEMIVTVTFDAAGGGTEVVFLCENLPPGIRPEDNEAGARLSLEQLARRFA
ncbi:MAG TPA: SRPBCC domain-containing protein [Dongiaceae bacterium]|nr:SRPBCC domain-containing protein [Dongiaceae bacterium]